MPEWLPSFLEEQSTQEAGRTVEDRMALVLALAQQNIVEETGGPFAAAVFEKESGRLVAAAVNRVVPAQTSIAHAETLALALAQQALGCHDLAASHLPAMELVASSQPCIQCYGNTWWSGVQALSIGARAEDVESIVGFHEGPLPQDWEKLLEKRPSPLPPVEVRRDLLREEARAVLEAYRDAGGTVYNAGSEG